MRGIRPACLLQAPGRFIVIASSRLQASQVGPGSIVSRIYRYDLFKAFYSRRAVSKSCQSQPFAQQGINIQTAFGSGIFRRAAEICCTPPGHKGVAQSPVAASAVRITGGQPARSSEGLRCSSLFHKERRPCPGVPPCFPARWQEPARSFAGLDRHPSRRAGRRPARPGGSVVFIQGQDLVIRMQMLICSRPLHSESRLLPAML